MWFITVYLMLISIVLNLRSDKKLDFSFALVAVAFSLVVIDGLIQL